MGEFFSPLILFYILDRMPETNFSKLELCNAEIKHSFGMCQVTGSSTENSLNSVTLRLVQTMLRPTIDCNISLKLIVNFIVFHITVTLLLCNRLRLVWMSLLGLFGHSFNIHSFITFFFFFVSNQRGFYCCTCLSRAPIGLVNILVCYSHTLN